MGLGEVYEEKFGAAIQLKKLLKYSLRELFKKLLNKILKASIRLCLDKSLDDFF